MSRDVMRILTEARPRRLAPDAPPADPATLMSHPREVARTPRPARRLVLAGAGLAAVAAVAAAVALQGGAPDAKPPLAVATTTAAGPDPVTAADLLLVAATRSDAAPLGDGRYWVLRSEHGEGERKATDEQWLAARPGDPSVAYFRDGSGAWSARPMQGHTAENNFLLAGRARSAAELAALPSRPAELKTQLLRWYAETDRLEGSQDSFLFYSGAAIVLDLPVPAPVRAAAYRMLAELPGIESLGRVSDGLGRSGIAVAYSRRGDAGTVGQQRLIVDPATGRALAQESWTGGERKNYSAIVKAEWSNDAPPEATALR